MNYWWTIEFNLTQRELFWVIYNENSFENPKGNEMRNPSIIQNNYIRSASLDHRNTPNKMLYELSILLIYLTIMKDARIFLSIVKYSPLQKFIGYYSSISDMRPKGDVCCQKDLKI